MGEALYVLLGLSVGGTALAALTWGLTRLLRGVLPKRAAFYLWLLVLARFCVPAYAPAVSRLPAPVPAVQLQQPQTGAPDGADASVPAPGDGTRRAGLPAGAALAVWAGGVCVTLAWHAGGYVRLRRSLLRTAREPDEAARTMLAQLAGERTRVRLVVSGQACSPMLLGLARPVIVIPEGCAGQTLRFALLHELSHLRRHDLAVKWAALLAGSLHWFNPAVYLVRRAVSRACELACDEDVVRTLTGPERRGYAETLLLLASGCRVRAGALTTAMCQDKARLKERLVQIMHYRKHTMGAVLAAVLALCLTACGTLAGPAAPEKQAAPSASALRAEAPAPKMPDVSDVPDTPDAAAPDGQTDASEAAAPLAWPLTAEAAVSTPFGTRTHPVIGTTITHHGVDLTAASGDAVLAAADGTVSDVGYDAARGYYVELTHADGLVTIYQHLSGQAVAAGDTAAAGDTIGYVGATGWATGPHLHFEVQQDGTPVDPLPLLGVE